MRLSCKGIVRDILNGGLNSLSTRSKMELFNQYLQGILEVLVELFKESINIKLAELMVHKIRSYQFDVFIFLLELASCLQIAADGLGVEVHGRKDDGPVSEFWNHFLHRPVEGRGFFIYFQQVAFLYSLCYPQIDIIDYSLTYYQAF